MGIVILIEIIILGIFECCILNVYMCLEFIFLKRFVCKCVICLFWRVGCGVMGGCIIIGINVGCGWVGRFGVLFVGVCFLCGCYVVRCNFL